MRGRKLYLKLAEASFENSLDFARDAKALSRRGSRGHAYSLVVLAVEEAAKAYLYKLAGEGVYQIVERKPNSLSTYSESQLFDHKFKHSIIARLVVQAFLLAPVGKVLAKSKRSHFTRGQVEAMLMDLLHEQELQRIDFSQEGRAQYQFRKVFETLERANSRKNSGFYVGHEEGRIRVPNDCPRKTLDEGFELVGVVTEAVGELLDLTLSAEQKLRAASAIREVAAAVKKASKKATQPRLHPQLPPRPGAAPPNRA